MNQSIDTILQKNLYALTFFIEKDAGDNSWKIERNKICIALKNIWKEKN